jgi:hypothetical protein
VVATLLSWELGVGVVLDEVAEGGLLALELACALLGPVEDGLSPLCLLVSVLASVKDLHAGAEQLTPMLKILLMLKYLFVPTASKALKVKV